MPITFEWDEAKNARNIAKHGFDFSRAIRIFDGQVLENADRRHNYGELRIIAFGAVDGTELTVVYTMRGEDRRIISARRSHKHERRTYRQVYPRR